MSISAITNAIAGQLGPSAQLINTTLHYVDGGRIQVIAATVIDPAGNRQTLLQAFVGNVDVAASAKAMAADWQAGSLLPIITDGPALAAPVAVKAPVAPPASVTPSPAPVTQGILSNG
jgi:hypothetical protein